MGIGRTGRQVQPLQRCRVLPARADGTIPFRRFRGCQSPESEAAQLERSVFLAAFVHSLDVWQAYKIHRVAFWSPLTP